MNQEHKDRHNTAIARIKAAVEALKQAKADVKTAGNDLAEAAIAEVESLADEAEAAIQDD